MDQYPELSDIDFQRFSHLVYEKCGINLSPQKKDLVRNRLRKRLVSGNFKSFKEYYRYVVSDATGKELFHLLDAISTNTTSFFRESDHFGFLKQCLLPGLTSAKKKAGHRKIRVWSAGCSTGEEPYSLAITLRENIENPEFWDMRILATDISTAVLSQAEAGIYAKDGVRNIPFDLLRKYFQRGERKWEGYYRVKGIIRDMVVFKRFNFMNGGFFREIFDIIFCRNVMIYFDEDMRKRLIDGFYHGLSREGYLFIGHSESLMGLTHKFRYVRPSIYRKK
jgi:chemotaxis protein methyltransferase CheR